MDGNLELGYLAGLREIDGRRDWPMVARQDEHGEFSSRKILLVTDVLVARDEQFEVSGFRRIKQPAVCETLPSHFGRPGYFVPFGVKENFHAAAAGWSNELLAKASTL